MGYKIKNYLFTILLFVILAFVIFFAIWKLAYSNLACKPITEKSESYGMTYNDLIHTYEGTVNNKYDVSYLEPTLLKFNAVAKVAEKPAAFYKSSNPIILTLAVTPKIGGEEFTYTVYFTEIQSVSAATKTDLGSVVIDSSTCAITADNTTNVSTDAYTNRIQKLVEIANEIWAESIENE